GGSGYSGCDFVAANAWLSDRPSDQRPNGDRVFRNRGPSSGRAAYFDSQIRGERRRALGQRQRSANSGGAGGGRSGGEYAAYFLQEANDSRWAACSGHY